MAFKSKMLRINDAYKNLLALIIANMPPHLRKHLLDTIDLVYRERVKHCDTKAANGKHVFGSIHFSYYNRYSKRVCFFLENGSITNIYQGDGVPGDTDPAGLHFQERKRSLPPNLFQERARRCRNIPVSMKYFTMVWSPYSNG